MEEGAAPSGLGARPLPIELEIRQPVVARIFTRRSARWRTRRTAPALFSRLLTGD